MINVSVVTLGVSHLQSAIEFYQRVFDWPDPDRKGDVAYFPQVAGFALALFNRAALADYLGVTERAGGFANVALSINVEEKRVVDRYFDTARDAGGIGLVSPHEAAWGGYVATFRDFDGHVWELVWNPRPFL